MKSFPVAMTSFLLMMSTYCLAETARVETVVLTKRGIQSSFISATIEMVTSTGEVIRSQIKRSDNLGSSSCFIAETGQYSQLEYSTAVRDLIKKELCLSNQEMVFSHYCETGAGHIVVADYPVTAKIKPQFLQINLKDDTAIPLSCD